ncbi:MAG: type II toxin-antitoxin system VapC family toxin [Anaerolineae bacterium]|nr:type II toxin-antitoxin system VapC family toxin [Anaerolineae bacterium]
MPDYLLDTNILLRAVQSQAPTHQLAVAAVASILESGDNVLITSQNLIEFWAVATRPIEANGLGWSSKVVETEVNQWRQQFPLLDERPQIFTEWLQLVTQFHTKGKQVHDARLVAVMQAYGLTHLLTFNGTDFERYPMITVVHPNQIAS